MKAEWIREGYSCAQSGLTDAPAKRDYVLFGVLAVLLWLLFAHPDINETARHAYILLRSIGDGGLLRFYENVYTLKFGYTYTNAAHYGIVVYLLYAVWELPLFLLEKLTGLAFPDMALALWCKAVGVAAVLGCAALLRRLGKLLGFDGAFCTWLPLLFCLHPVTLFTVFAMGQYDSLCLVFLLLALCFYCKKDLLRFSLVMGAALVFKFFALFAFLPLLLLAEKRLLHVLKYAALSLWLYLPTTLLFWGRTADAGLFNQIMADRLFAVQIPGGLGGYSAFGLVMGLVCMAAWLWRPEDGMALCRGAAYLCLAVYTTLFLFTPWHPQWVLLLVPFSLLELGAVKEKRAFALLELVFTAGFFLLCAFHFPGQLEGDMLDMGILQPFLGLPYSLAPVQRHTAFYFDLVPYLQQMAPLAFYGALTAGTLFRLPLGGMALADRLRGAGEARPVCWRAWAWGLCLAGFAGCWLLPTLFGYGKTVGLL